MNLELLNISPDTDELKQSAVENWLTANGITFLCTSHMQYKILNGCERNIMLYPSTSKIMFQVDGRNHIIQTSADNIIAHIKGNLVFRK